METITTINTGNGKLYITKRDKSKLAAYSKSLEAYEKELFKKYGRDYMLRITKAEYKKALKLHNDVYSLTQKIKRSQKSLKNKAKK